MVGQLDKRRPMLQWQPATCCIFQLFIIICYLANKVLLLLLLQLLDLLVDPVIGRKKLIPAHSGCPERHDGITLAPSEHALASQLVISSRFAGKARLRNDL